MSENKNSPSPMQFTKSLPAPNNSINFTIQQKQAPAKNKTGLPDNLKSGIEHLSGIDISYVKVHYNSAQPAQLNAHACAQGNQIHIASGQQKHLAHEVWHVVQQKQGKVKATKQLKGKVNINDSPALEKEADVMGSKALNIINSGIKKNQVNQNLSKVHSHTSFISQRIRIKLDHANDMIMNNVRAAKVPRAGDIEVDGFKYYKPEHAAIKDSENIILEGHGTYLHDHPAPNAPYDSQAELNPQQLANIAYMIPKSPQWHGQIILFGCATGTLTLEVSKHYLALSGKSVNVVGTLADIKMEVPNDAKHKEHHADYERGRDGKFPQAPEASLSARKKFCTWVSNIQSNTERANIDILIFNETVDKEVNRSARIELAGKLQPIIQGYRIALASKPNYEGLTYNENTSIDGEVKMIRLMLEDAILELSNMELRLHEPHSEQSKLEDKGTEFSMFFNHVLKELDIILNIAAISMHAVPEGVVDWEGSNVVNSKADDAEHYPTGALPKAALISDRWGNRGGGQMMMHVLLQNAEDAR